MRSRPTTSRGPTRSPRRTASGRRAGSGIRSRTSSSRTTRTSPPCCVAGTPASRRANCTTPPTRPAPRGAGTSRVSDTAIARRRRRGVPQRAGGAHREHRPHPACDGRARRAASAASACTNGRWSTARPSTGILLRCASDRRHRCRRRERTTSGARTSMRSASSRPTPCRATATLPPARARPRSSSRAASTPAWTSTSGPSSSARSCRAICCSTRSRSRRDIRTLDMQASPYDLTDVGLRARRDRVGRGQGRVRAAAARVRGARSGAARAAPRRHRRG